MAENLANRFITTHSQHKYGGALSAPAQPLRREQGPAAAAPGAGNKGPQPWLTMASSPRLPSPSQCKQGL